MSSEKANVKSEKIKVTLSVHQVVNYTQEVELYPWELRHLESEFYTENKSVVTDRIIKKRINLKKVYHREGFFDIDILDKESHPPVPPSKGDSPQPENGGTDDTA